MSNIEQIEQEREQARTVCDTKARHQVNAAAWDAVEEL